MSICMYDKAHQSNDQGDLKKKSVRNRVRKYESLFEKEVLWKIDK